jgi:signal transduction histidine kinase/DNA-binding response OmpR family regulator
MNVSVFPYASVLIVDDNPGSARTLRLVLAAEGYEADCAATAAEARQKAGRKPYDAALIDIALPDESGLDLLSDLKSRFPEIIAIMVTGHASTENSIAATNRGASGYVQKPVEVRQLLTLLRSGLEKKWLQEENARMVRHLSLLHSVETTVSQGLDSKVALAETISLIAGLLEFEAGAIWWSAEPGGELCLAAAVGLTAELEACCHRRVASIILQGPATARLNGRPWFDGTEEIGEGCPPWFVRLIALRGQKGIMGWLMVGGQNLSAGQIEEAEVLGTLAGEIGVAMENMCLFRDLSSAHERLQEAQAQLVQAEKLTALGRFISGIAHEINNPLAAIIGYSELLAEGDIDDEAPELARRILQQAQRCGRIVQGVLTFGRGQAAGTEEVSLAETLSAAVAALAPECPETVQVVVFLDPSLPTVTGDPASLQQVFVNIISNAYQLLSEGGGTVSIAGRPDADGALVEISDTGPGIPEAVLPRVFDPFFTTKQVGKGSGLGLSVVHGVVEAHGGHVWAGNRPEGGARLSVWLPARTSAPAPGREPALVGVA